MFHFFLYSCFIYCIIIIIIIIIIIDLFTQYTVEI